MPDEMWRPRLLGHTLVHEEHGKLVFRETFEEPLGNISEWLLFGARMVPVVLFALDTCSRVIVLSHFRYGANECVLELPGGAIDKKDHTPEDAAKRELKEEAGHEAGQIKALGDENSGVGIWFDPASVQVRFLPIFASGCEKVKQDGKDLEEHIAVKLTPIDDWFGMLRRGEVRDSKSYAVSILALPAMTDDQRKLALSGLGSHG